MRFQFFRCLDFYGTVFRFYFKNHAFARTDFAILSKYWLDSPFAISKRYLQLKLEPDVHQYGETPLLTIEKIAQKANITERDHVFELGCGTGRCAFWLAYFRACSVTAIEQIPDFVDFSNQLVEKNSFLEGKLHFIRGDFLSTDLSQATVIYLYGTKMTNSQIESLIFNLNKIQLGTTIITVSYSLNEIIAESKNHALLKEYFAVTAKFAVEFLWGKATVFIQKKLQ
ncbi:MAG: methyltransferase domain-containing protein [Puniceicoccales bacterium]|jgi:SAM-dependent methyltransferase|nr:methyltransferase domain-containing protein [Puniceicoccales bacterium]